MLVDWGALIRRACGILPPHSGAFDGLTTIGDYDREAIRQASTARITGVPTFVAGAGKPPDRQPALYAIEDTADRRRRHMSSGREGGHGRQM